MIRIAICDDEVYARETLELVLDNILIEDEEEIVCQFSSGKAAVKWLSTHPGEIDVLFLNAEMKDLNGMSVAKEIRKFNQEMLIIFITSNTGYISKRHRVHAMEFLAKPVEKTCLKNVMQSIREKLNSTEQNMFVFHNTEGTFRFPIAEIEYFHSAKRMVTVVHNGESYNFYGKLDEVESQLRDTFVRIHQRYLINAEKVTNMNNTFVILGDTELPISRTLKDSAIRKLEAYMFEG